MEQAGLSAEVLQIIEREVVTEQVQEAVEQHRCVTVRQDETIAQRPARIVGIEAQVPIPMPEEEPRS